MSCAFRIPGPAGAYQQSARNDGRQQSLSENRFPGESDCNIPQGSKALDNVYKKGAWLTALKLLKLPATYPGSGSQLPHPIGVIRAEGGASRQQLDPTGSMKGMIHRKVLQDKAFGPHLGCGSVLILRQVVVFSPRKYVQCLNITIRNVQQVLAADTPLPFSQRSLADDCAEGRLSGILTHSDMGMELPVQGMAAGDTAREALRAATGKQAAAPSRSCRQDGARQGPLEDHPGLQSGTAAAGVPSAVALVETPEIAGAAAARDEQQPFESLVSFQDSDEQDGARKLAASCADLSASVARMVGATGPLAAALGGVAHSLPADPSCQRRGAAQSASGERQDGATDPQAFASRFSRQKRRNEARWDLQREAESHWKASRTSTSPAEQFRSHRAPGSSAGGLLERTSHVPTPDAIFVPAVGEKYRSSEAPEVTAGKSPAVASTLLRPSRAGVAGRPTCVMDDIQQLLAEDNDAPID